MSDRLQQLERVGCGATAEIYRAALLGERGTRRIVAVKRLRPELASDADLVELFVREAHIAVALNHPNVVQALELGRDQQGYFLVAEWVEGCSLAELRERAGPLPWTVVARIGSEICHALAHLHEKEAIVHRDVTPANIMVTHTGDVKLADFGIASCKDVIAGREARGGGTSGFAAPEQLAGGAVDGRADIYGLAASLEAVVDAAPAPLVELLQRASAAAPEQRFAGARELGGALEALLASETGDHGRRALLDWLGEVGGVASRTPRVSMDHAVRSLLGGALQPAAPAAEAVAPAAAPAPRRRWQPWVLLVPAMLLAVVGLLVWPAAELTPVAPQETTPELTEVTSIEPPADSGEGSGNQGAPATATAQPPPTQTGSPSPAKNPPQRRGDTEISPRNGAHEKIPPPRPPDAKPLATGSVRINSIPWAAVRVDGRALGNTPLEGISLPAGEHLLELHHPPNGLRHTLRVEVVAERDQTLIIDLRAGTVERRIE